MENAPRNGHGQGPVRDPVRGALPARLRRRMFNLRPVHGISTVPLPLRWRSSGSCIPTSRPLSAAVPCCWPSWPCSTTSPPARLARAGQVQHQATGLAEAMQRRARRSPGSACWETLTARLRHGWCGAGPNPHEAERGGGIGGSPASSASWSQSGVMGWAPAGAGARAHRRRMLAASILASKALAPVEQYGGDVEDGGTARESWARLRSC